MARKLVEDFQNVSAKEPVLILQDNSSFKIRVTVPEQDMASGRSQNVDVDEITRRIEPKVTVTPLPDRSFDARLYELSLTADPVTRTFDATFVMDAPEGSTVLPGMTAKVKIQAPGVSAKGYWVPGRAVWADEAETSYVWKLDPESDRVSRAPVELGAMSGDTIQIVSGLSRDDVIVISGVKTLADGVTVRPLGERIR
jgi:RND family efflux transporter MFP subunit